MEAVETRYWYVLIFFTIQSTIAIRHGMFCYGDVLLLLNPYNGLRINGKGHQTGCGQHWYSL